MSITAVRASLSHVNLSTAAHPGLLLNRYLRHATDSTEDAQQARRDLLDAARHAVGRVVPLYDLAYKRREHSLPASSRKGKFKTQTRLIIGLGGHHVLETGLTLHHTYGTPIIPGTALKGLASKYCHRVWGEIPNDPPHAAKFRGTPGAEGDFYRVLFGTQDEGGLIAFDDAWITSDTLASCLRDDVMTPHHGDYYSGQRPEPTDFDDPKPIPFLSLNGTFLVVISADRSLPQWDDWLKLGFALITEALREWGVGGKTNSGYGRLIAI